MGYVFLESDMQALKSSCPIERRKVHDRMLKGYNRYREGMRGGLFGVFFGQLMFPDSGDKKGSEGKNGET